MPEMLIEEDSGAECTKHNQSHQQTANFLTRGCCQQQKYPRHKFNRRYRVKKPAGKMSSIKNWLRHGIEMKVL